MFDVFYDDPDERCGPGIFRLGFTSLDEAKRNVETELGHPLAWALWDGQWHAPTEACTYFIEESDVRNIVHQQLDHIWENWEAFEEHTGSSGPAELIEYFVNQIGNDKEDIYWRLCSDLGLEPRVEHTPDVIHATMLWPRTGPEWSPLTKSAWTPEQKEQMMADPTTIPTMQPVVDDELETRVQNLVAKALGGLTNTGPQEMALPVQQSFEDALLEVDPRDSEAALAMLDFLIHTGRLGRVGVLDNGAGYLFMYQEPKGSTKAGYKPGATQGDRIVDKAVEAQREAQAGQPQAKKGVCKFCISAVVEHPEGVLVLESPGGSDGAQCESSPDGKHVFAF